MPTRPRPTSTNAIRSAPVLGSLPEKGVDGFDDTATAGVRTVVGGVLTSSTSTSGVVDGVTIKLGGTELDELDVELGGDVVDDELGGADVVDAGIGGVVVTVGWHPGVVVVVERGGTVEEVATVDVVAGLVVDVVAEHTSEVVVEVEVVEVELVDDELVDDELVDDELVEVELVEVELVVVSAGTYV